MSLVVNSGGGGGLKIKNGIPFEFYTMKGSIDKGNFVGLINESTLASFGYQYGSSGYPSNYAKIDETTILFVSIESSQVQAVIKKLNTDNKISSIGSTVVLHTKNSNNYLTNLGCVRISNGKFVVKFNVESSHSSETSYTHIILVNITNGVISINDTLDVETSNLGHSSKSMDICEYAENKIVLINTIKGGAENVYYANIVNCSIIDDELNLIGSQATDANIYYTTAKLYTPPNTSNKVVLATGEMGSNNPSVSVVIDFIDDVIHLGTKMAFGIEAGRALMEYYMVSLHPVTTSYSTGFHVFVDEVKGDIITRYRYTSKIELNQFLSNDKVYAVPLSKNQILVIVTAVTTSNTEFNYFFVNVFGTTAVISPVYTVYSSTGASFRKYFNEFIPVDCIKGLFDGKPVSVTGYSNSLWYNGVADRVYVAEPINGIHGLLQEKATTLKKGKVIMLNGGTK